MTRDEQVDFILHAEFPLYRYARKRSELAGEVDEETRRLIAEADERERDLRAKNPSDLLAAFQAAVNKKRSEQEAAELYESSQRAAQDARMFWHERRASADFDHWSRQSYWTIDEAVALSMGKEPSVVNWGIVRLYPKLPFAVEHARKGDLVTRAKEMGQLSDRNVPSFFLAWAERTRFECPPELIEAVKIQGNQIADWKTLYEDAQRTIAEHNAELRRERERVAADTMAWATEQVAKAQDGGKALAEQATDWAKQQVEIARAEVQSEREQRVELMKRIEELEQALASSKTESLGTRERESLLKLVIGMAVAGYRHRVDGSRSTATQEIADDLAKLGIPLDADTVRKHLKAGAELLPPPETE